MDIICVLGKKIKVTDERLLHVKIRHPELEWKEEDLTKTLKDADFVQKSFYDEKVLLYYRNIGRNEYFVVVVKILNSHGFILTSYIANVIKKGEIVWKK